MATILSIETATTVCSASISVDDKLLEEKNIQIENSHSSHLTLLIDELINSNNLTFDSLDAIAISRGPGSYTGLRIGTSTAKGLCFGLNIPLISVNTLTALAHQLKNTIPASTLLCPMIDARRMEVYCAIFDQQLKTILPTEAKIIDNTSFRKILNKDKLLFFGNGSGKCKGVISHPNASFIDAIIPSASSINEIAFQKYLNKDFENLAYFEPYYLKDFLATKPKQLL